MSHKSRFELLSRYETDEEGVSASGSDGEPVEGADNLTDEAVASTQGHESDGRTVSGFRWRADGTSRKYFRVDEDHRSLQLEPEERLCLVGSYTVEWQPTADGTDATLSLNGVALSRVEHSISLRIDAFPWQCLPVLEARQGRLDLRIQVVPAAVPCRPPASGGGTRASSRTPCAYRHEVFDRIQCRLRASLTKTREAPTLLVVGARNSGKSILAAQLTHLLLQHCERVAYIDLDVGQNALAPPGCLSAQLVHSVAWPLARARRQRLRTLFYGYVTPLHDPRRYVELARRLLHTARAARQSTAAPLPLVINTIGWVHGFGATLAEQIAKVVQPTLVLHTDAAGASEDSSVVDHPAAEGHWFVDIASTVARCRSRSRLRAADERAAQLATHLLAAAEDSSETPTAPGGLGDAFRRCLYERRPAYPVSRALCSSPPWCIGIDALDGVWMVDGGGEHALRTLDADDNTDLDWWQALNGSVVALCTQMLRDAVDGVVGADAVGVGLVRAVDASHRLLYLVSAVSAADMAAVSALAISPYVQLPATVLPSGTMQMEPFLAPPSTFGVADHSMEAPMHSRKNLARQRLAASTAAEHRRAV